MLEWTQISRGRSCRRRGTPSRQFRELALVEHEILSDAKVAPAPVGAMSTESSIRPPSRAAFHSGARSDLAAIAFARGADARGCSAWLTKRPRTQRLGPRPDLAIPLAGLTPHNGATDRASQTYPSPPS